MSTRTVRAPIGTVILLTVASLIVGGGWASSAPGTWQKPGEAKDSAAEILRLQSDNSWFSVRACSADGKRVAWSAARLEKDGSHTILIIVGDRAGRKVVPRVVAELGKKGPSGVASAVFSPDGDTLLVGFRGDQVLLLDVAGGKPPVALENDPAKEMPWQGQPLVFSPDGKVVLGGAVRYRTADKKKVEPQEIAVWDAATGKILRHFGAEWPQVDMRLFRVSGDGRTLLAQHSLLLNYDKKMGEHTTKTQYTLRLWDYATGKVRADSGKPLVIEITSAKSPRGPELAQFPELVVDHGFGVRVSPTGRFMIFPRFPGNPLEVSRRAGNVICLTDWTTGKDLHRFEDFDNRSLLPFEWASGGNTVAANGGIGKQNALIIWDITPWSEQAQRPLPDLTAKELADLWEKLGHEDPMVAYRAMRRLAASPKQSLPFLKDQIDTFARRKLDVAKMLAQLDDENFAVRQQAQKALLAAGEDIVPALRKAIEKPPSAEARQRMEKVLAELQEAPWPPEMRRVLWGVELLEHLGSGEARKLLEALAAADPEAWVPREARAALDQWGARR